AGARHARRRSRRLRLPAEIGEAIPRARPVGGDGRRGRPRSRPLSDPRRRHHRHPLGGESRMTRSAVPPPVTLVLDAAEAWLPARMAAVEGRLAERAEGHGAILAADARATLE